MFVKKDLRKIPKILSDALQTPPDCNTDDESIQESILTHLRLSRRPEEFNGSISILCNPNYKSALQNLTKLSLYDCQISSLENIGTLACPSLQDLNLGRNPLKSLPDDLAIFRSSLKRLWCDDCQLTGKIPHCVFELQKLEVLRMSNNQIKTLNGDQIERLQLLKILCLDGNDIEIIPQQIGNLSNLESLLLRKNNIKHLPEGVPGPLNTNMSLLHVSSNQLQSLPISITGCISLEYIYANGNSLQNLPVGMGVSLENLRHFNASNNEIKLLPHDFIKRFGEVDANCGECTKDSNCKIILHKNPFVEKIISDKNKENETDERMNMNMDIT